MKKILIIGSPGSGKSYFSKILKDRLSLPLFHLDNLFWNKDKTHITSEELKSKIEELFFEEEWIIDGNYFNSLEMRLKECDTVFYLDYSLKACLEGVRKRIGKLRDDIPWIEEKLDEEFVEYIKDFHKYQNPEIKKLLKKYSDKKIILFKSREELQKYLEIKLIKEIGDTL